MSLLQRQRKDRRREERKRWLQQVTCGPHHSSPSMLALHALLNLLPALLWLLYSLFSPSLSSLSLSLSLSVSLLALTKEQWEQYSLFSAELSVWEASEQEMMRWAPLSLEWLSWWTVGERKKKKRKKLNLICPAFRTSRGIKAAIWPGIHRKSTYSLNPTSSKTWASEGSIGLSQSAVRVDIQKWANWF